MNLHPEDQNQQLRASIRIARENLYVFKDSSEKAKWERLLDEADEACAKSEFVYAGQLVDRVAKVVDNLWKRIERWQKLQFRMTVIFLVAIALQLAGIALYLARFDIVTYGFHSSMLFGLLGGSVSVALSIGQELDISGSNRLKTARLVFRPLVGVVSALVAFSALETEIIKVSENLNQGAVLVLLSVFAGYSERFLTRALSDFVPKLISKS